MAKLSELRALVRRRLKAAAEDICELLDEALAELEEEVYRQRRQRDAAAADDDPPQERHQAGDIRELLASRDDVPLDQQQEWISSPDHEDPEPQHVKEEGGAELWSGRVEEQLQMLEEEDDNNAAAKLPFTPVRVKSEDDEENFSEFRPGQTEQSRQQEPLGGGGGGGSFMQHTEADDCGGSEAAGNMVLQMANTSKDGKYVLRLYGCSECGKSFCYSYLLERHMRIHTGEKPYRCSLCGKGFRQKGHVTQHMTVHSAEKPFSCRFCHKSFTRRAQVRSHKCVGESSQLRPGRSEAERETLASARHAAAAAAAVNGDGSLLDPDVPLHAIGDYMASEFSEPEVDEGVHDWMKTRAPQSGLNSREIPVNKRQTQSRTSFSCSDCGKVFYQKENLKFHMRSHTGRRLAPPFIINSLDAARL